MTEVNLVAIIVAIFASTGFWTFLTTIYKSRQDKKKSNDSMASAETVEKIRLALLGVMHALIFSLGNEYVERGKVTIDEYDNFFVLYDPYEALGGNGTGKRLAHEVDNLPIVEEQEREH